MTILSGWFDVVSDLEAINEAIESLNDTGLTDYHCSYCEDRNIPELPNDDTQNEE